MTDEINELGASSPIWDGDPYELIAIHNRMELGLPVDEEFRRHVRSLEARALGRLGNVGAPEKQDGVSGDDLILWLQEKHGLVLGELFRADEVWLFLVRTADVPDLVSRYPDVEVFQVVPERGSTGRAPYLRVNGVTKKTRTHQLAAPKMSMKNVRLHRLVPALSGENLNNERGTPFLSRTEVHHKDGNILNNDASNLEIIIKSYHIKEHADHDPAGTGFRKESLIEDWVLDRLKADKGMLSVVVIHAPRAQADPKIPLPEGQRLRSPFTQDGDHGAQERQVVPGAPEHGPHEHGHEYHARRSTHDLLPRENHGSGTTGVDPHGEPIGGEGALHSGKHLISSNTRRGSHDTANKPTLELRKVPRISDFRRSGITNRRAKCMRKVYRALLKLGGAATKQALDDFTSLAPVTTWRTLDALIRDGWVTHEKYREYVIAT